MMILEQIAVQIIKPIIPSDIKLNIKKDNHIEKSIILDYHRTQTKITLLGNDEIKHKHITATINGTNSYTETEHISQLIYDALKETEGKQYDGFFIKYIVMDNSFPIDNERNKEMYFSKIINFEIYYD